MAESETATQNRRARRRKRMEHTREELHQFWQRVTEGRQLDQLWTQFRAEARESYGLYSREVDWEAVRSTQAWKRPFHAAWALFQAMLMKLSPARRVLLLLAGFLFVLELPSLLVFLLSKQQHTGGPDAQFLALSAALFFILLALELADRITMKRDLEIAREIQHWLVPEKPPQVPGLDIAFATRPANTVAGDYYDAFLRGAPGGERLFLVIADVAGKSVPAALLMATFQASLQALSATAGSLDELVAGLNRYACAHSLDGRRFTTAFFAEIDPATRVLRYINAGHNAPMLRRVSGRIERLETGGLPLGIPAQGTDGRYQSGEAALGSGDLLVVFTDGLVEAENVAGEEFGEAGILPILNSPPRQDAEATLQALMAEVDRFVGPARQHDDVTCMVLRAV
jgi:serine phosphatase RsbU (regulator of sigma subunit)